MLIGMLVYMDLASPVKSDALGGQASCLQACIGAHRKFELRGLNLATVIVDCS